MTDHFGHGKVRRRLTQDSPRQRRLPGSPRDERELGPCEQLWAEQPHLKPRAGLRIRLPFTTTNPN
ncbi:hypothetical protein ACFPN7_31810 [Amycolatopsis halotolerans]|uniref:hypothetical protein n=1 Tax=Amycolatopsis halotolerans TaxID=330083 RepID=UPI00360DFB75